MNFKPAIWYPIAVALTVINVLGIGYAVAISQPAHAALHVGLALAFGAWARHLRRGPEGMVGSELDDRLAAIEFEVSTLRQELGEAQERLDFAERLLAQAPEARRVEPLR